VVTGLSRTSESNSRASSQPRRAPRWRRSVTGDGSPEPLVVDLELEDGRRLTDCQVAGYWGGALGERWFGIGLDLDACSQYPSLTLRLGSEINRHYLDPTLALSKE
jgi:hypothetical protein